MSNWRMIIEQVEAGYGAYRWILDHAFSREKKYSNKWFGSVTDAESDCRAVRTALDHSTKA